MKIRSLTLNGFKSFADRTKVEFHGGITAIVGPNGCGKSNISDALRWVLGEQRPSAIRGSRMEEAIFQGTSQRKPIHRAEVILQMSNEDGVLAVPYTDVAIGRTVLRGGESILLTQRSDRPAPGHSGPVQGYGPRSERLLDHRGTDGRRDPQRQGGGAQVPVRGGGGGRPLQGQAAHGVSPVGAGGAGSASTRGRHRRSRFEGPVPCEAEGTCETLRRDEDPSTSARGRGRG